jgi:hypothetical protein
LIIQILLSCGSITSSERHESNDDQGSEVELEYDHHDAVNVDSDSEPLALALVTVFEHQYYYKTYLQVLK